MFEFDIAPRFEDAERWEENEMINAATALALKHSIRRWFSKTHVVENYSKEFPEIMLVDDTPFSTTTIRSGGHAVCCFAQGMAFKTRNPYFGCSLEPIALRLAERGYYEPMKGVYHNLFDHVGCRRATDIKEIVHAILFDSMATCLVDNRLYHGESERTGSTYVNIVGLGSTYGTQTVIIDDPFIGRTVKDFDKFVKSLRIAWIW